jgi:methylenetetrahydrofolate dehydrogenase (NADP+) / methenyltetrahydrofolate cyclohydrolase
MSGRSLSGRELAADIRAGTAAQAAELTEAGRRPHLAIVTAVADEASAWYVRSLARAAATAGIGCDVVDLIPAIAAAPENAAASIEAVLAELSAAADVHGIILQTPLPLSSAIPGPGIWPP